jgi:cell division transport system permease protein
MAANRPIIEVLHFIGARDGFIARQFQRHFLVLGLKGGFFGGGAAIVIFLVFGLATTWLFGSAGADQFALLFGTFSIGWEGYLLLVMQILLVAVATAWTSRQTVHRTLAAV